MSSMASSAVSIQTSPESVSLNAVSGWGREVAIMAHYLEHLGLLEKIVEGVRFARARFEIYDTIDFVVVLMGYALSGESHPQKLLRALVASLRGALYGPLGSRAVAFSLGALSAFLASLDQPTVSRPRKPLFKRICGPGHTPQARSNEQACRIAVEGSVKSLTGGMQTRQAARQRALPTAKRCHQRHDAWMLFCAAGYTRGASEGRCRSGHGPSSAADAHGQWFATYLEKCGAMESMW